MDLVAALQSTADKIMLIDGDRDHMNRSDLRCEDTQHAAKMMRAATDLLSLKLPCDVAFPGGPIIPKGAPLERLLLAIQGKA